MNKDEILDKNKAINVIWIAMLIASIIYIFITFYVLKLPILNVAFNTLSLTLISFGFFNILVGMFIIKNIRNFLMNTKSKDLETLFSKMFTLYIMAWGIIESCAVFGLVLSVIEKNAAYILMLALPALVAIFFNSPRPSILKEIIRQ
jgi:hypothetical protein